MHETLTDSETLTICSDQMKHQITQKNAQLFSDSLVQLHQHAGFYFTLYNVTEDREARYGNATGMFTDELGRVRRFNGLDNDFYTHTDQ